jgi:hypothetical protein
MIASRGRAWWVCGLVVVALVACSSDDDPDDDDGIGGGFEIAGRQCGMGAPCGEGATCEYVFIESGATCTCDPSGHFLCDSWASGGEPPYEPCNETVVCQGQGDESCTLGNGFCTRSCTCDGGCTVECDGSGPAVGDAGQLCDADYCADVSEYGGCAVHDGGCDYEVRCATDPDDPVTGECADAP